MGGVNKKRPSSKTKGKDKGPKQAKEPKRPAAPKEACFLAAQSPTVSEYSCGCACGQSSTTVPSIHLAKFNFALHPIASVLHARLLQPICNCSDYSCPLIQEELQVLPQERVMAVRPFWERVQPEDRPELLTLDVADLRARAAVLTERYQKLAGACRQPS
jgi:hypothetical protein